MESRNNALCTHMNAAESVISGYKCRLDVVLLVDETTDHVTLQIGSGSNASSHSSTSTTEGDEKRLPEDSPVESVDFKRIHSDERCDIETESEDHKETTTAPIVQQEETQQPAFLEALSATLAPQKTNKVQSCHFRIEAHDVGAAGADGHDSGSAQAV